MIRKILAPFRAIWQLLSYVLFGLIPLVSVLLLRSVNSAERTKFLLFCVDFAVCLIAHGKFRTISGLTGDRAKNQRRYHWQAKVIDLLAFLFERKWAHCERANTWEHSIDFNFKMALPQLYTA